MNKFRFIPIPQNDTNVDPTTIEWNLGKIDPDGWALRIHTIPDLSSQTPTPTMEETPLPPSNIEEVENETTSSAIPIKDWNMPNKFQPPSPPHPPSHCQNSIKQEHASKHLSTTQLQVSLR